MKLSEDRAPLDADRARAERRARRASSREQGPTSLRTTGVGLTDALNTEDIAEPIIATLIGAMALLVSVPLTTALAAALVHRVPARALPDGGHHHHH